MHLDMSDDYQVWDSTETVSLVSVRLTGDMTGSVRSVRRHLVGVKEQVDSGGVYTAGDVLFYVPRGEVPASLGVPKPGDWVYDDQYTRYTVLTVDHRNRDHRQVQTYKLQARDLAVAFQLEDLVTIESPVRGLDDAGARVVARWVTRYENLPARVQLVSEAEADERGIRGGKATYTVIVDRQIRVAIGEDRIKWVRGRVQSAGVSVTPASAETTYLDIVGYRNPERVDELPSLDAEERP